MSADTLILVYDPDGDSRMLPEDEVQAMVECWQANICPNDEEDEVAGWHSHVFVRWHEYDEASRRA